MVTIIVAAHGESAPALLKTAGMILGNFENVHPVTFLPGQGPEDLVEEYTRIVEASEAAESLILEGGYGALNAEALAERAGVSRRTIFNHFASVDDVLGTRLNQYFNRIFEECDFTISGENASMEAEMLSIARKVFMSSTLEEYIAPCAQLLYSL